MTLKQRMPLGAATAALPPDDEELLRIEPDCTSITKLGKSFLHAEAAAGRLRTYRFGRAVRVRRSDLMAWIAARGVARVPDQADAASTEAA